MHTIPVMIAKELIVINTKQAWARGNFGPSFPEKRGKDLGIRKSRQKIV